MDEILSKGLLEENGLRHIERTTNNANTGSLLRVLQDALDAIDADIRSVFGDDLNKVITPDDVRGTNESLEAVILVGGWPTIGESRGKVFFGLDIGGAIRDEYVADHPALEGRVLFTCCCACLHVARALSTFGLVALHLAWVFFNFG